MSADLPKTWVALAVALVLGAVFHGPPRSSIQDYAVCSPTSEGIYTVDPAHPTVQCILVRDTYIADTGSLADITTRARRLLDFWRPPLNVSFIDPKSIIIPGLADAHAHILSYGSVKLNVDLSGCASKQEVLQRLVDFVKARPDILNDPSKWIQGMGWDQNIWAIPEYPHADDFDAEPLLRGRRIYLDRIDGHAAWVSRRVLQLMGELPNTVDGGEIIRDGSANPTGIFVDNAMSLIPVPPPSKADMLRYFDRTVSDALAVGLTSIHDAATEPDAVEFYRQYAESKRLPLRLYLMGHLDSVEYWGDKLPHLVDYGVDKRLNLRSVKLFTDGALGSSGAALLEPYSDNPSTSGIMRIQEGVLSDLVKRFHADGWQVNVHCIGDRANRVVLDIFEDVFAGANMSETRPRIEHAQILTLEDLERMGRLGVIPSVQPTHATSDMWYAEQRRDLLWGPERIRGAYAYRTMIQTSRNQVLPLGSDFPVEGINPLLGFYAAVTRLSISGKSPHGPQGWYPEQRLTRFQALKGMTLDAAYASFSESAIGSLAVGKKADFVVLDRDIMTVPESEILGTKVQATVIDGEVVYGGL
ncbi:amidohydrolase family-domain-containing protein [Pisolithus croceorrhizus]|nr:amidohydrolase family-domain-containing protein [Pisolithus croceorrhizus]KAI6158697.1 amidohydrolase family-domain-containing protein [Pisolithus thermaeus]